MKKLLPFLLLLSLLLCACGGSDLIPPLPAVQNTEPVSTETMDLEEASAQTMEEPVVEFAIEDIYFSEGVYTDSIGNRYDYLLRIPAIRDSGDDAQRLSQELYDKLYPYVQDALDAMDGQYSLGVCRVDYTIYQNGDLCSLVARVDTDWGFSDYYAVNYDRAAHREADRVDMLSRYGLTELMFLPLAADKVDELFQSSLGNIPRDDFWKQQHDRSIAPENFREDCWLYADEANNLCMIFKLYSLAGGDYYYHSLPIAP